MMRHLYQWFFYDLKLGGKFFITNLLTSIVPAVIVMFLFINNFYSIIENNVLVMHQSASFYVQREVDNTINELDVIGESICSNPYLEQFLTDEILNSNNSERFKLFCEGLRNRIEEGQASDINIYFELDNIDRNTLGLVRDLEIFKSYDIIENTYWNGIFQSTDTSSLIAPNSYLSEEKRLLKEEFAIIKRFEYISDGYTKNGYVAVYYPMTMLSEMLGDASLDGRSFGYIVNNKDSIIVATNENNLGIYQIDYDEIPLKLNEEGEFFRRKFIDQEVYMIYRQLEHSQWRFVWIIPQQKILKEAKQTTAEFMIGFLVLIILVFALSNIYSRSMVRRIRTLKNKMEQVKVGRPISIGMTYGKDEIGELITTYDFMARRISLLMDKELETAHELHDMKIHALRAQIDPHFLYNTLDMIKWLSIANKTESVVDAIDALSKFYRLTLNKGNMMGLVREEIEHVSLYVKLINYRFGDNIDFIVDIPDEVLDYKIPMIIFQPIIENSILHGIFEKDSQKGSILLTGWIDKDDLYFDISDDGVGMSKEVMDSILSKNKKYTNSGIGVYNTHRRLQMIFNSLDYGLTYKNIDYGQGVEVEIRIPKS